MKLFLRELETAMAAATPEQRIQVARAYQALIRGVVATTDVIGGAFKPSGRATVGLLGDLMSAMTRTAGGAHLMKNLRTLAPTIGPHVAALVQSL